MWWRCVSFCFFFFSSRRRHTRCALVTGVQTCALPISFELTAKRYLNDEWVPIRLRNETWDGWIACEVGRESLKPDREELWADQLPEWAEIGRASCRERVCQYV